MLQRIKKSITARLARFLTKTLPGYERLDAISIDEVAAVVRAADIVLVEGNTRISTAIKYLTQSSWSHACLYVGGPGEPPTVGNLLEADLNAGVRLVSLQHYENYNLRICRPAGLSDEERQQVAAFARARLGHQYDMRNVFDLVRYLIQKPAVPVRFRRAMIGLGSGEPTKVICSTLIAEAFQSVGYPILPLREEAHREPGRQAGKKAGGQQTGQRVGRKEIGQGGEVPQYYRRHFTHFTPRDFDLSPYFNIVKPTLEQGFDPHALRWGENAPAESEQDKQ